MYIYIYIFSLYIYIYNIYICILYIYVYIYTHPSIHHVHILPAPRQIFSLPGDFIVCPGHDYKGRSVSLVAEDRSSPVVSAMAMADFSHDFQQKEVLEMPGFTHGKSLIEATYNDGFMMVNGE